MNILETLCCLRDLFSKVDSQGFVHKVFINRLVDIEVSAFPIYYTKYLVSEEELEALKENEFIPKSIRLYRQCEEGHIPSLIEAITKLGDILGEKTQIIFPKESDDLN